ncbi:hypothetical protein FIBSPDRAFT_898771 [Athelia psychrophila]|uniref:Uncharacterized protein n=1 Tax=Athelia psychrophila TaxID=1759441 RepID=A0A166AMW8_9AGAM|nr:hypothetical protein FIBSPDRAFT_898771 [Fibularhizoctonia sp. CBS 109695]
MLDSEGPMQIAMANPNGTDNIALAVYRRIKWKESLPLAVTMNVRNVRAFALFFVFWTRDGSKGQDVELQLHEKRAKILHRVTRHHSRPWVLVELIVSDNANLP